MSTISFLAFVAAIFVAGFSTGFAARARISHQRRERFRRMQTL